MKNLSINPHVFDSILEKNEEILWISKPNFIAFLSTGLPFLAFGLMWGALDYSLFSAAKAQQNTPTLFIIMHLAPFYLSILNMFRLLLVYKNTYYGITKHRLLYRGGFFGIDSKSIEYDKVQSLEINVNPLENILKVGTIKVQLAAVGYNNRPQYNNFVGIETPNEVFKKVKETSRLARESHVLV